MHEISRANNIMGYQICYNKFEPLVKKNGRGLIVQAVFYVRVILLCESADELIADNFADTLRK